MNPQAISALRILFMLAGSFAVGQGWVSQKNFDTITEPSAFAALCGAAAALAAAGWALWARRPHGIIKDAAALPQVDAVVVKAKTASKIPVANVVGSVSEAAQLPGIAR